MMIYCYETPDGEIVERVMTVAEMKAFQESPESEGFKRRIDIEHGSKIMNRTGIDHKWRRGLACEASAVHPSQVDEFKQIMADHGCPTDFKKTGEPIYHSRDHRRRAMEIRGLYDRNGGYGDG
jgi:hypothetical protein